MPNDIDSALYGYLVAFPGLVALISNRVYLMKIPQAATLPCLTLARISTTRTLTHDQVGKSGSLEKARFQFDAWATTYAAAKAITDQVRDALQGRDVTSGAVKFKSLVDSELATFETETGLYRSQSDFLIWSEE